MYDVQLIVAETGRGAFFIAENNERLAEMEISIKGNNLTSYHTETFEKGKGLGLGKKLLEAMVDHARRNGLMVTPLCPFVYAQFKRYPEKYSDIWNQVKKL
jgi:uncharacterized protein